MIYGKPVARLWARCAESGDGVIVGVALKNDDGSCPFEPNTIYEAVRCELSGDVVLHKVGRAAIRAGEDVHPADPDIEWLKERMQLPHIAQEYAYIALCHPKHIALSAAEIRGMYKEFTGPPEVE